jgi:membrane-associated phospholipid phosphatase
MKQPTNRRRFLLSARFSRPPLALGGHRRQYASMTEHPRRRRSAEYRRKGPEPDQRSVRLAARVQPTLSHLRRVSRAWLARRWLVAAAVPAAVAVVGLRKRLGVPPVVSLAAASLTPLAVAAATPLGKWRYIAVGSAYMWTFKVTWELPYETRGNRRRPMHIRYPIRIDSLLGGGVPPTVRLQRSLRDQTKVTPLDRAVAGVYGSWLLPHLILGWILMRHPEFIPRAAGRLAATYHLTTPFYWLIPTAPPWWASESEGEMNGEVQRVLRYVIQDLRNQSRSETDNTSGNPWGSMPSDHIASAAITAMALSEISTGYAVLGWSYVVLASFAVIYLGEHYLIDVLAGLAVAETVRRAEPLLSPIAGQLARVLGPIRP